MGDAIRCELLRAEVFAGQRTPMVFGQPDEWLALLIESLLRRARATPRCRDDLAAPRLRRRARQSPGTHRRHSPSRGSPTPTRASARCSRPVSTAATTGCRSPGCAHRLRAARGPARLRLDAGAAAVRQRRRDRGAGADALPGLRGERATARLQLARKTEWRELRRRALGRPRPARARHRPAASTTCMAVRSIELDDVPAACRGGIVAGLTAQERLQPSLLDRLTDDAPTEQRGAARSAGADQPAVARGRAARPVLAVQHHAAEPDPERGDPRQGRAWSEAHAARRSVLNYGIAALSGITLSRSAFATLELALQAGDPAVRAAHRPAHARGADRPRTAQHPAQQPAASTIRGQLWSQPVPLELLLRRRRRSRDGPRRAVRDAARLSRAPRWTRACCATTTRSCATCARWAASSRASSRRSPRRLGMEGLEVADPYVERLLEGFAFLAARVQLKLDAEFPRFRTLLEMSIRTSWRRCRRCWWRGIAAARTTRTCVNGFRCRAAARCWRAQPR